MQLIRTVTAMRRLAKRCQIDRTPIGFVPTMGCLHAGHLSLIKHARRAVGRKGKVVVSIFVNPAQFGPGEDLSTYPRDFPHDRRLCQVAGTNVLFIPDTAGMYPEEADREFSTYVIEEKISRTMEGNSRPAHFRGVATVVAKLFNIVLPSVAVFGAKDFQQAAVIRRMVRDLNFPVKLMIAPTIRDPDGLALSSRNFYLSAEEREQAPILWRAIQCARQTVRAGPVGAPALRKKLAALIQSQPAARLDYIDFFDPETLAPVDPVRPGVRMALAVFLGKTRLIDNEEL